MFEKIMVYVDGSNSDEKVLDYAIDIAKKYNAGLTLITVVETEHATSRTLPPEVFQPYSENEKAYHRKVLDLNAQKVMEKAPGMTVDRIIRYGEIVVNVLDVCDKGDYNLIVVGNKHVGGFKEMIIGDISKDMVEQSPAAVLVVK
jgi:nucleotide-binding universal stress UspA family protein